MTTQSFNGSVNIVVTDAILFTHLLHNGRDLWIMGLNYSREQMVGGLVVESASEHCPEPASCGIILCCSYLELSPEGDGYTHVVN